MKKSLLISILFLFSTSGFAQTYSQTYPGQFLYGTSASADRTYRALQLGTQSLVDVTVGSVDTITLIPGFVSGAGAVYHIDYFLTVSDTIVLAIRDVSSSYTASEMTFYITSPNANSLIKFLGYSGFPTTQWALTAGATSVAPTQNHWLIMHFKCTGTKWVLASQVQD